MHTTARNKAVPAETTFGTVTSVGLAAPSIFSVSGSPVTAAGTLTLSLSTQDANSIFAGPISGSVAAPAFRSLVDADIPSGIARKALTLSQFASTTSLELKTLISDETGSGALVFANTPTLIAPILGTPTSGIATNLTGTASGLTAGNVTTNANLTGPITSVGNVTSTAAQTGTGSTFVVQTSPTLTTPNIGVATATSINGNTITTGTGTLTIAAGKVLTQNNSIIHAGTDGTTMTYPTTSATLARTDAANTFTGHQTIEGVTSTGATGTGNLVFSASPTFTGIVGAAAIASTGLISSGTYFRSIAGSGPGVVAYGFLNNADTGLYYSTSPIGIVTSFGGSGGPFIGNLFMRVSSTGGYAFTSTTDTSGTIDTAITRTTGVPGSVSVGTGAAGSTAGSLSLTSITALGTFNKVTITAPASAATLTIANNKTFTVNNTITLAGTDAQTYTFPTTTATVARTDAAQTFTGVQTLSSQPVLSSLTASQAVFTDSSKGLISNAITGTGNVVMSASPTFTGNITAATAVFTKAAAGDTVQFTNAGSTPSSIYIYTDSSVSGVFAATGANGSGMIISAAQLTFYSPDQSKVIALNNSGSVFTGIATFGAQINLKNYTVATLPVGPSRGDKAYVTDALAPTYLTIVVGGGAIVTEVFHNGVNWVCT